MDMLSRCRKNIAKSSEAKRRSPRIAQQGQPSAAKKPLQTDINDKCFANIDKPLPAISQRPNGNIVLTVLAKPGAKQSGVIDIADNCIGVRVGAPAREGEANAELVNYLASILQLRKTNITIEKGLRSQIKSVVITKKGLTVDNVRTLVEQELGKGLE